MSTISFESTNDEINTYIPYKWLFVATVPICLIFGFISVFFMIKQFRSRRGLEDTYVNYITSTNQNDFNYYDLCYGNPDPDMEDRDHEENGVNVPPSTRNEGVYLTVEDGSDLV